MIILWKLNKFTITDFWMILFVTSGRWDEKNPTMKQNRRIIYRPEHPALNIEPNIIVKSQSYHVINGKLDESTETPTS